MIFVQLRPLRRIKYFPLFSFFVSIFAIDKDSWRKGGAEKGCRFKKGNNNKRLQEPRRSKPRAYAFSLSQFTVLHRHVFSKSWSCCCRFFFAMNILLFPPCLNLLVPPFPLFHCQRYLQVLCRKIVLFFISFVGSLRFFSFYVKTFVFWKWVVQFSIFFSRFWVLFVLEFWVLFCLLTAIFEFWILNCVEIQKFSKITMNFGAFNAVSIRWNYFSCLWILFIVQIDSNSFFIDENVVATAKFRVDIISRDFIGWDPFRSV